MYIYYNPEELGLEVVDTLGECGLDYAFNTLIVWKNNNGELFWAQDSGCSCPVPFEDYTKIEDLNPIVSNGDYDRFEKAVNNFPVDPISRIAIKRKVRQLLKQCKRNKEL